MTCDSAPKVCGVYNVGQVFNQQFTQPGEELEVEVVEGTVTICGCTDITVSGQRVHVSL